MQITQIQPPSAVKQYPHELPSGAVRKGESFEWYNTSTHVTVNTETVRGTGVTPASGKTIYITDIWYSLVHTNYSNFVHLYLKVGTRIFPLADIVNGAATVTTYGGLQTVSLRTPIAVADTELIQFADKSPVTASTVHGAAAWQGYEL